MKTLLYSLILIVSVAGCRRDDDELIWKEDVLLQDGRTITLDRKAQYRGSRELTQKERGMSWYSVDFDSPVANEKIHWESKMDAGTKELVRAREEGQDVLPAMKLMAILVKDGQLFLVMAPRASFEFYRCPDPPYVLLKRDAGQWRRVNLEEIPYRRFAVNVLRDLLGAKPMIMKSGRHVSTAVTATQTNMGWPYVIDLTHMTKQTFDRCSGMRDWTEHESISN